MIRHEIIIGENGRNSNIKDNFKRLFYVSL